MAKKPGYGVVTNSRNGKLLDAIRSAGARGDQGAFMRLYTENRISYQKAIAEYRTGQKLAKSTPPSRPADPGIRKAEKSLGASRSAIKDAIRATIDGDTRINRDGPKPRTPFESPPKGATDGRLRTDRKPTTRPGPAAKPKAPANAAAALDAVTRDAKQVVATERAIKKDASLNTNAVRERAVAPKRDSMMKTLSDLGKKDVARVYRDVMGANPPAKMSRAKMLDQIDLRTKASGKAAFRNEIQIGSAHDTTAAAAKREAMTKVAEGRVQAAVERTRPTTAKTKAPTVAELKAQAKAQGLKGYSKMTKAQLSQALGNGPAGWSDAAREASAKVRGAAEPGKAKAPVDKTLRMPGAVRKGDVAIIATQERMTFQRGGGIGASEKFDRVLVTEVASTKNGGEIASVGSGRQKLGLNDRVVATIPRENLKDAGKALRQINDLSPEGFKPLSKPSEAFDALRPHMKPGAPDPGLTARHVGKEELKALQGQFGKRVKLPNGHILESTWYRNPTFSAGDAMEPLASREKRYLNWLKAGKPKKGPGALTVALGVGVGLYALSRGASTAEAAEAGLDTATMGAVSNAKAHKAAGSSTLYSAAAGVAEAAFDFATGGYRHHFADAKARGLSDTSAYVGAAFKAAGTKVSVGLGDLASWANSGGKTFKAPDVRKASAKQQAIYSGKSKAASGRASLVRKAASKSVAVKSNTVAQARSRVAAVRGSSSAKRGFANPKVLAAALKAQGKKAPGTGGRR